MTTEIILIAGPTASGKTSLSVSLAKERGGVVINADSMQVYKDLSILSARPTIDEMEGQPHKLFGIIDPKLPFSVADWHDLAKKETLKSLDKGKTPILVGGTGLYFKAALEGLADIPEISDKIRNKIRDRLSELGAEVLHGELQELDLETANRLKPQDGQRIARALEVVLETGIPLSEWQKNNTPGFLEGLKGTALIKKQVLDMPREMLYERINKRFDQMVEMGALEEVKKLMERNINPEMPAMKALGIPSFINHLKGNISLEEAVVEAKTQTRRYAKRQMTWFRNQFENWPRVNPLKEEETS